MSKIKNSSVIHGNNPQKCVYDVIMVTKLHALSSDNHYIIDKFIELYAITLQFEYEEEYKSWISRKAAAETSVSSHAIDAEGQFTEFILFTDPEPIRPELKTIEQYRAEILIDGISINEYIFRTQRDSAVKSITVEVDGLVFDGDEQSQRRMISAIQAGTDQGMTKIIWRLHNNDENVVTIEQLKEAHAKAILAQGELWMRKIL